MRHYEKNLMITSHFLDNAMQILQSHFFIWLESIQHIKTDLIKNFDEFESLFNEFIESSYNNLDSIEGFFGFAPVESKSNHWGKVFENNQHATITL